MSNASQYTYPDWGVASGQLSSPDSDMGELAARLGSPTVINRSGRVIWFDRFEAGLSNWYIEVGSAGAYNDIPYQGNGYLKLVPPPGPFFWSSQVVRKFMLPLTRKMGVELMVAPQPGTSEQFSISLYVNSDDVNTYRVSVVLDFGMQAPGSHLYVFNLVVNEISEIPPATDEHAYRNLKVVFNLETHTVERIYLNGIIYTVNLPFVLEGGAGAAQNTVKLIWHDPSLAGKVCRIDDVVVTIDEA